MPEYAKGLRFIPGSSRQGRSMASAKGTGDLGPARDSSDPAVREHNARIEEERQARLARRKAKKEKV